MTHEEAKNLAAYWGGAAQIAIAFGAPDEAYTRAQLAFQYARLAQRILPESASAPDER